MIYLSKNKMGVNKYTANTLYGPDGYIHIAGMKFIISNGFCNYLNGTHNVFGHSGSVDKLDNLIRQKGHSSLHKEARKYEGYQGRGIFPEFNTESNLKCFALHLQRLLGK